MTDYTTRKNLLQSHVLTIRSSPAIKVFDFFCKHKTCSNFIIAPQREIDQFICNTNIQPCMIKHIYKVCKPTKAFTKSLPTSKVNKGESLPTDNWQRKFTHCVSHIFI